MVLCHSMNADSVVWTSNPNLCKTICVNFLHSQAARAQKLQCSCSHLSHLAKVSPTIFSIYCCDFYLFEIIFDFIFLRSSLILPFWDHLRFYLFEIISDFTFLRSSLILPFWNYLWFYLFEIIFPPALCQVIRQLIQFPQIVQNSSRST